MMHPLKGVIFSLRDVLVRERLDMEALDGVVRLMKFLLSKGIQPVLVANTRWHFAKDKQPFEKYLSEKVGCELPFFVGGRDFARKESAGAMATVLDKFGWGPQNALFVGSTILDMRAAANGKLLFLNAQWYAHNSPYGFEFSSALDIARFIDCCCLTPEDWFWKVEENGLRFYSIAPLAEYSPRHPEAAEYSTDAKRAG